MKLEEFRETEEGKQLLQEIGEQMRERFRREQREKVKNFKLLNRRARKGAVLFTGSSLMEQFHITEFCLK